MPLPPSELPVMLEFSSHLLPEIAPETAKKAAAALVPLLVG
jgi:hypothetical protein